MTVLNLKPAKALGLAGPWRFVFGLGGQLPRISLDL
jgi:hypothetical protein